MSNPFIATPDHLARLAPIEAVRTFRDLLGAEARRRGIPVTAIHISERIDVADGGIDAEVDAGALTENGAGELLDAGTGYQIKTGTNFKPWQRSEIHDELFGRKEAKKENLGVAVRRCLDRGRRYVLACFGVDPTPEEIHAARQHLIEELTACGYVHPNVAVWGQSHLVGLLRSYPSLCLRVTGREGWGLCSHSSWAQDADMQPPLHLGPEQERFIEEVRSCLRGDEVRHVRVVGEPGSGKSRLVLEATRADDLAPLVVHVHDANTFRRGPLFEALRQPDNAFSAILVIDSCPVAERAWIWNALRGRSDRARLVTLDDGPEEAVDGLMRVLTVPPLEKDQVTAITADYLPSRLEAKRWAEFCEGSPRAAHVVGMNLHDNPDDLLRPPATVPVWDRFICGHDAPDSVPARQRRVVLHCLALFERFGFGPPVQQEAQFIQQLAAEMDPSITWPRFCEIVQELRRRGILRGVATLHLTPRLLHVALYREFWNTTGAGHNLTSRLRQMPGMLPRWFAHMLRYAHTSQPALEAVRELLGPCGPFAHENFLDSQEGGELLLAAAEAEPRAALGCLRHILCGWSVERLECFREGRRNVVWALERLAYWEDCFEGASGLLLALGEAENETCGNNASSVFAELFRLVPGLTVTQAAPARRLPVLRAALRSPSAARRCLGVRACRQALETRGGMMRLVGPEYQGLRPELQGWWPATYGELYGAFRQVWELLVDETVGWAGEERRAATGVLIETACGLLDFPRLVGTVLTSLEQFAADPTADRRQLIETVTFILRYDKDDIRGDVRERLARLDERLRGGDFGARLRRFITLRVPEDDWNEDGTFTCQAAVPIETLAKEAASHPELLKPELTWLVADRTGHSYNFGYQLAQGDPGGAWLGSITRAQQEAGAEETGLFLGGYLAGHFKRDPAWWEQTVLQLAEDETLRPLFGELVFRSGLTARVALHAIGMAERGEIRSEQFGIWLYGRRVHELGEGVVTRLLRLLLAAGSPETLAQAIVACEVYYCREGVTSTMPEETAFALLTHEAVVGDRPSAPDRSAYHWSQLAGRFLDLYPHRAFDLLVGTLLHCERAGLASLSSASYVPTVLERIVALDPAVAWDRLTRLLGDLRHPRSRRIRDWLAGDHDFDNLVVGPIRLVPTGRLWAWVDGSPDERASWLAEAMPPTLDPSQGGSLTREFLCRYGDREEVANGLMHHFHCSSGWCDSEADHYRTRHNQMQGWLSGEVDPRVASWLQDYITWLESDIHRAEVQEERRS